MKVCLQPLRSASHLRKPSHLHQDASLSALRGPLLAPDFPHIKSQKHEFPTTLARAVTRRTKKDQQSRKTTPAKAFEAPKSRGISPIQGLLDYTDCTSTRGNREDLTGRRYVPSRKMRRNRSYACEIEVKAASTEPLKALSKVSSKLTEVKLRNETSGYCRSRSPSPIRPFFYKSQAGPNSIYYEKRETVRPLSNPEAIKLIAKKLL